MKQFLYIATLFFALFFSCMDWNVAYGQNMAREYNPNSPWNQTGESGYYQKSQCDYCDTWITGYTEYEFEEKYKQHIKDKHPQYDIDNMWPPIPNGDSDGEGGGSSSNSGNSYSENASWVYVDHVAHAMQSIGKCNYDDFINECLWYGIAKNDISSNSIIAAASTIVNHIKSRYNTKSNIALRTAINRGYNFIIFARPPAGKYYNVYTNYNIGNINTIIYDYLIVF